MRTAEDRRERLAKFIDLAKVYRGWSRNEVSRALGRDAGKLLPESGNPKLDLVVGLANALDWSVGDIVDGVWTADEQQNIVGDYTALDAAARAAHANGKFREMLEIANQMGRVARTPSERALAANRLAGAYDGLGQYNKSVPCLQAALSERGIPAGLRLMLTVNLANAHYCVWNLTESRATAHQVLELLEATTMTERRERVCHAFAHYVRGNSFRRLILVESDLARIHAQRAHDELSHALNEYEDLADTFADERYAAIANTCRGALLEVQAALGELTPSEALERLTVALDRVVDVAAHEPGDWLESWGWWCIFGCNVALRHFAEDAMGRFPNFRAAGWRILNEARFIDAEGGARWLGA